MMPHRTLAAVALACLIGLIDAPAVMAQTIGGAVSGSVTSSAGEPLTGASVTLVHSETSLTRQASSDSSGRYRLTSLPPGIYRAAVTVPGFAAHTTEVRVPAGQTVSVDVQLHVSGGTEAVQVVASPLQRDTAELGGIIDRELIVGLPVNGRSFEQLTLLEPGVLATTSRETSVLYQHGLKININGASSRSNAFLLDGTSITDFYNNGLGSAAGTFLGIEAVREFRVLTNAYDASHGGVSGGTVSIITKSGSSSLHGSLFGTVRDGRLDARGYFDADKPEFWRRQTGLAVGGPIIRQRAFYFVTGEWLRESRGITQVAIVPSIATRDSLLPDPLTPGRTIEVSPASRPFLDLYPLPNGPDLGGGLAEHRFEAVRPSQDSFGQARVDLDITRANRLFARFTIDGADRTEPGNFPGSGVDWASDSRFLTVEDQHVLSGGMVNTLRVSYSLTDLEQTDTTGHDQPQSLSIVPGRGLPHLVIGGMPTFGSLVSPHTRARQRLLALSHDLALSHGPHLIKAGALVERFDSLVDFQIFWTGRFSFPGVTQFLQARPSVVSLALPGSESLRELTSTQFGVYAQDDIKVTPRVTVTAGLRWEFATAPREREGRLVGLADPLRSITPVTGTLLETDKANLAPRLGVTWMVGGDERTVVRAGSGLFYDINTLPFVAQTVGNNPPFYRQVTIRNPAFPNPALPPTTELSLGVPAYQWHTPRLLHFNAAIERELPGRSVLTVAYAGSLGRHIVRSGDTNAPVPVLQPDGNPIFAAGAPRRNPAFGAISLRTPDGESTYDSLQVKLLRRLYQRLQFQLGYVLARTLDDSQGTVPTESEGSVTQWMDPDRAVTDRGPADFARRHNFTANLIWTTPSLTDSPGPIRQLFGGWIVGSIVALRSGTPFTVGIQGDYSRTLARVSVHRPDLRAGVNRDDVILGGADHYFDPSAFELQAPGTFGNAGRNSFTAPGIATVDLALTKAIVSGWPNPAARLEFRVDLFNVLNRTNLGMPQRIIFSGVRQDEQPISTAGRITSTTTGPREAQLSLRASW